MLFEVWGPDGKRKAYTEDASCIYDERTLKSLQSAGHTFKIDGNKAPIASVASIRVVSPRETGENGFAALRKAVTQRTRVKCVDTGKIYSTQSDAAKDLGIDSAQVSDSIKTGKRRSGYLFERVE